MPNPFQTKNLTLGQLGEKAAAVYLKKIGYGIICTNFTNSKGKRLGEIDIVAKDDAEFVFVEVKTRKGSTMDKIIIPEENINFQKLHKLKKIADFYIKTNNLWNCPHRFDALSLIQNEQDNSFKIKHLKNIFL